MSLLSSHMVILTQQLKLTLYPSNLNVYTYAVQSSCELYTILQKIFACVLAHMDLTDFPHSLGLIQLQHVFLKSVVVEVIEIPEKIVD